MMKILSIIKKNFKLIMRSRISALIILFGPLLIMLIVGLAFNSSSATRINVGYYSPEYNNLTDSFMNVIQKSSYNVNKFDTVDSCKESILAGDTHICIIFPENFTITNEKVNNVVFMVDNSKINFFETVVDSIERDFNQRALELTTGMTQELIDKLNETQESIANKSDIITRLKEDNSALKQNVKSISKEVSGLDLSFDYNSLNVDDLEDESTDMTRALHEVKGVADDAVKEANDLIDDLEGDIKDINMSSADRESLLDKLNESGTNLDELESKLNGSSSDVNTSGMSSIIKNLKSNLHDVESRFEQASKARDVTVDKIDAINTKLNVSMAKILLVEDTFNSIYSNIAMTQVTDVQAITKPIQKVVQPVVSGESQLNFFFPYLVVLIVMFIGLLLSSTLMIMEKTSQAHFRNFVTPTRDITFVFGAYATTLIVMLLQLTIIILLFSLFFKKDILTNLQSTAFILIMLTTFFSFLGMAIGNLFNSEETGTLAAISIGSIMLFVSDLIFPLERMPQYVAEIAGTYNPFVIGSELLRKAIVHDRSIVNMGTDLYLMLVYTLIIFLIMLMIHKFMKRTFLLRWSGYIVRRELRKQEKDDIDKDLLDRYMNIKEEEYFIAGDDRIGNLKSLLKYVEKLDDETYRQYVDKSKNAFAEWAEKSLKNADLAMKIRKAKGKKRLVSTLRTGAETYDKLKKKYHNGK